LKFQDDHPRCAECVLYEERQKTSASRDQSSAIQKELREHLRHAHDLQQLSLQGCARARNTANIAAAPISLVVDNKVPIIST
jgi:hypothetical protein